MNNRIYPKDIFIRETERREGLVVRKLLIEKKNKIELIGVIKRVMATEELSVR